jgi:thioesterase domain-containing protein
MSSPAPAALDRSATLCLLPFRRGPGPTLFYVHEVSGSVLHFASVASRLADRGVVGIQSIGLNPGFQPDTTVEEMAHRYVTILRAGNHAPPYDIIGYSMGGLVAFEMAARLAHDGNPVRLGLLDAPVPGSLTTPNHARVIRIMARGLGIRAVVEAATDDVEDLLALLVAEAQSAGTLPATYTVDDLRPSVELQLINSRAATDYLPTRPFPGDIHLLCAKENAPGHRFSGWRPFVDGRIHGEDIEGDHFSILRGPNAARVADIIARWMAP